MAPSCELWTVSATKITPRLPAPTALNREAALLHVVDSTASMSPAPSSSHASVRLTGRGVPATYGAADAGNTSSDTRYLRFGNKEYIVIYD